MKTNRIEFPICDHFEMRPTTWNQQKPEPARTIGECPIHNYICPVCGYGAGCYPSCDCSEMRS